MPYSANATTSMRNRIDLALIFQKRYVSLIGVFYTPTFSGITMKKTARLQKVSVVTVQDVLHILILIAISLVFCLMPANAFGQPLGNIANDAFPTLDSFPPPALPTTPAPVAAPVNPSVEDFFAAPQIQPQEPLVQTPPVVVFQPELPEPAAAPANPITASQFAPVQSPAYQSTQLRSPVAVSADHPFVRYWGTPNDPQTKITGKPMTVAELLAGTRSPAVRRQLLQAYWELGGLLAIYHFRCENERLVAGVQQDNMTTLLREQRRTAEVEFIKQQWVLAGLLNQHKGRSLRELELPIPSDFPLYPRYQTFADQLARTERTQYLGRMIPIQEQLIESKNGTWRAASEMVQSASQPLFVISTQRTMAFLDLTSAIIEYNKMIAEYALETIPPNVSQRQLVAAVVRVGPPTVSSLTLQESDFMSSTHYAAPAGVTAQPVVQVGYEYQPAPVSIAVVETDPKESEAESELPAFLRNIQ